MAPGLSPPVASRKSPPGSRSMRSTGQRSTTEPPIASTWPSSASMKPWLSMMPVQGERRAAPGDRQRTGDGQAHRTGADDDGLDVRCHEALPEACGEGTCGSTRKLRRTIDRKIQY